MKDTQIIILAAGHGKRMKNGELPKVLIPLRGKPMIQYVLKAIHDSTVNVDPVIIIGQKAELVKKELGPNYTYVLQKEQLGTGHAVACAKNTLIGSTKNVLVLYGDTPLVTAQTISELSKTHDDKNATLTMATITVPNFEGLNKSFYDFGRIVRNADGNIIRIVEKKDATEEQQQIKELNPNYLCFKSDWLWNNISKLKDNNSQKEYYLTDLITMACDQQKTIASIQIDPQEGIGINSPEQLQFAEQILKTS